MLVGPVYEIVERTSPFRVSVRGRLPLSQLQKRWCSLRRSEVMSRAENGISSRT
jgi:hypothetical protein